MPTIEEQRLASRKKKRRKNTSLLVVGLELCFFAFHRMSAHALLRPRLLQHHRIGAILSRRPQVASKWSSTCTSYNRHHQPMFLQSININSKSINDGNIILHTRHHSTITTQAKASFSDVNESNWPSFTEELEEILELPTISVPAKHIHWLLSNKESPIKSYLAHTMDEFEGIHPKIKIVRNLEQDDLSDEIRKRVLLSSTELIPDDTYQRLQDKFHIRKEDTFSICIPPHQQPVTRILTKLLPEEAQPPPSSYEQVGHVVHVNLKAQHMQYGRLIGSILLDRLQPTTKTIVNKLGEVGGPFRTYQMDLLAGEDDYFVHVVEHGISLYFDLRKVYWCTRLEGERTYMLRNEFKPNQVIADAFCGCGAQLIRAASKKGCRIIANDLNPGM